MSEPDCFDIKVDDLDQDLAMILNDEDLNVRSPWAARAVQNNTFPLPSGSFKGALPQALPSLPLDHSHFSSARAKGNSFRRCTPEQQTFYSPFPLCFGEEEASGHEAHVAVDRRNSSTNVYLADHCLYRSPGLLLEERCCPDDSDGESCNEARLSNTVGGNWSGVLDLVKDLNGRFTMSENAGTKNSQNLKLSEQILIALSAIQQNVEKVKAVVPIMARQKANFSPELQRQCSAAAGALIQISQLADAAVAMGVDMERQLDAVESDTGYFHEGMCCGESPSDSQAGAAESSKPEEEVEVAKSAGSVDCTSQSLPNFSVSPATVPPVKPGNDGCDVPSAQGTPTGSSEIEAAENDFTSLLIADLLSSCDRITGLDSILDTSASSSNAAPSRERGTDLEEALRAACVAQLKPESFLLDSPILFSPEPPIGGNKSGTALQPESDELGHNLVAPGSFTLMEVDDSELLTEQKHACKICSKAFKREANLRMHMRSHGGKYKSLVRLEKESKLAQETTSGGESTRYSCPFVGCVRNIKHSQFQPLKTMLCLKNHYRRSHCAKTLKCGKCRSKQFSVLADLKTHEKHCGSADRWACSCGTTFSRKEKLQGHVRSFDGHTPVDISTRGS